MAIGMEIEIAVPIDQLSVADINQIRNDIAAAQAADALNPQNTPAGNRVRTLIQNSGHVPYGTVRAAAGGFRIDADHDDRVRSLNHGVAAVWPPLEGGSDSIIEIVMSPPADTETDFNTTMNNINAWVNTMMLQTQNLTRRWVDGIAPGISVGPLTFPAIGVTPGLGPRPRRPNHNLKGSCQVNIGIDLREYHSLLKWFANSRAARSHNETDPAAIATYRQSKDDIRAAVNIGRQLTATYAATLTAAERSNMGNLRGLRGWITHMALYVKRGTIAGGLGGSPKNLAPSLLKSPPAIAAQYGMSNAERNYFNLNHLNIINDLLNATGRGAQVGTPLATVPIFATVPGGNTLADLTDLTGATGNEVPLAGGPLLNPTAVGPTRTGNGDVQAIPSVPGAVNTRGGIVAEVRNIPGYYDGVAAWRQLGLQFLREAIRRNRRSGIHP